MFSRRQVLIQGAQVTAGIATTVLLENATAGVVAPAASFRELRGGIARDLQNHGLIHQLYFDFIKTESEAKFAGMGFSPLAGTYKESFGYYFKHQIVDFGLVSSLHNLNDARLRRFDPRVYPVLPQKEWQSAHAALDVFPLEIAKRAEALVYLQRKNRTPQPGDTVVTWRNQDQKVLSDLGFHFRSASDALDFAHKLKDQSVVMTGSLTLPRVQEIVHALRQNGDDHSWEVITDSRILAAPSYNLLFRMPAWTAMSDEQRSSIQSIVSHIHARAEAEVVQVQTKILASLGVNVRKENTSEIKLLAEKIQVILGARV